VEVTADGDGVVGHAGALLLSELADRLGLPGGLDRWAGRGQPPRVRHRSGRVLTDVAVMLADGGDCLSDIAVLRDQPEVFGGLRCGRGDADRVAGAGTARPGR